MAAEDVKFYVCSIYARCISGRSANTSAFNFNDREMTRAAGTLSNMEAIILEARCAALYDAESPRRSADFSRVCDYFVTSRTGNFAFISMSGFVCRSGKALVRRRRLQSRAVIDSRSDYL